MACGNKSENENVRLFYPSDPPAEKRRGPGRGPVSDPMRLGGGLESSGSFAGQNGESGGTNEARSLLESSVASRFGSPDLTEHLLSE